MKRLFVTLLTVLFISIACKKEESKFEGYTATDVLGNSMGTPDPTDWTFDNYSWTAKEQSLFGLPSGFLSGTSAGTITVFPTYPNPCAAMFNLTIQATAPCKARIAIASSKLELQKYSIISVPSGNSSVSFTVDPAYKRGQLYRVYYIFDAENNIAFKKGHGDIMVQ